MAECLLKLRCLVVDELGQTNVELGAILVVVSIISIVLLTQIATSIPPMFQSAAAGF